MVDDQSLITETQKTYFEIVLGFIGFTIVCGNVFVLVTMYRYPRVRTVSNMFIISLAVSDLIVGLLTVPVTVTSLHTGKWVFGSGMCSLSAFMDNMAIVASIWNLQMSSIDRYVAITRPLQYKILITYNMSYMMIGVVWVVCAVLAMFPLVGWDRYIYSNKSYSCGINGNSDYFLCFLILGIFVPLFVTIYSYLNIGYCAIKHSLSSKRDKQMQGIAIQKQAVKKRNLRISVTVLSIIGAFIVCTLPLFVMGLLQFCGVRFRTKHLTDMFVHVLLLSNSALNPILYSFGTYQFREAFVDLIYCRTTGYQLQTRQFRARTTTRGADVANSQSQRYTDENVRAKRTAIKRASSDDLTGAVEAVRKEKELKVKEEKEDEELSTVRLTDSYPMSKNIKFGDTDDIVQI
ncbi:hypothetical protein ACHWQZ_G002049 [Mnemiopsis leidyi]